MQAHSSQMAVSEIKIRTELKVTRKGPKKQRNVFLRFFQLQPIVQVRGLIVLPFMPLDLQLVLDFHRQH